MSFASNVSSAFTRVATEFKAIRVLISGSGTGGVGGLTTTSTNLVGAINELVGISGIDTLDELTDVVITTPATGHILRWNGTNWVNVVGTTYFDAAGAAAAAQSASQPVDSDLTAIAALTTTTYGRALLTLADQAALLTAVGSATLTQSGVIELATQAEVDTGTDAVRAVAPSTLASRLTAYAQPLDSDLTSIAALTTTSYGRAFLALANQAALMALLSAGTATAQGILELATDAEAVTGSDTARATTPANVAAVFLDRIDTSTALGTSNVKVPSQNAVKSYVDASIGANDAMVFKGVIDCSASPNYPAGNRGDTWKVSVAGKIGGASGPAVDVGDLIICITDSTATGNHATVGAAWTIVQVNIDGAVTGPASSVSGNFASFNGTGGKVIQDSGISVDTDAALTANSNVKVPSQAAVKAYAQPLDSDLTSIAALTTTSFGRALLTLADASALAGQVAAATETLAGKIEIATQAETNAGTDDARAITPLKFQTRLAAYAQPLDTDLTAIAALTSAADKLAYATGAGTWAMADLTTFGRSLIDDVDAAAARTTLSVYSQTQVGDPATDFVAAFEAGLL